MSLSRRQFLALASLLPPLSATAGFVFRQADVRVVKPKRFRAGATIGLISPGGAIFDPTDVDAVRQTLSELGLRTRVGRHALKRRGYLAGADAERAADVNAMFADPDIDGILALRGGWGCNRILPLIDFESVRAHPKILMGFSDVTSLLLAMYARTGLVTFHGPVGISSWNDFTVEHVRRVLFRGETLTMSNPRRVGPPGVRSLHRIQTITPGWAEGRLAGGNLSVLTSMLGSGYLPDWRDHILFLEDTREEPYRIDRMLTQLALAGVLSTVRAVVFGMCTRCDPEEAERSLSLQEVLRDHLAPLSIPSWYGAMIGHASDKFTLPIGIAARVDAGAGTISLLEPAVG